MIRKHMRLGTTFLLITVCILLRIENANAEGRRVISSCEEIDALKKDAVDDDPRAQLTLANEYFSGRCLTRNPEVGAFWLNKSASLGLSLAQGELSAFLYRGGDYRGSASVARSAATQGDDLGQLILAKLLLAGKGIERNDTEALYWARLSAENGNGGSQSIVGFMYETGRGGINRDNIEADKWYIISQNTLESNADKSTYVSVHEASETVRKNIEVHMSKNEIQESGKRASFWIAGHQ